MNDHDHTTPQQTLPDCPVSSATPGPSVAGGLGEAAAPPPPLASSTDRSASVPQATRARRPRARSLPSKRKIRLLLAAAMMSPVIGLSVGLASSPSASAAHPASTGHAVGSPGSAGGGPTHGLGQPQGDRPALSARCQSRPSP
jgi:hypothetical protein